MPQHNLPKLRFPGFIGEWESDLLENIAEFSKGKNISKADISAEGEIECIRYGELYTDYEVIINKIISKTNLPEKDLIFSKSNDIVIPSSGETQLDIARAACILKDGVALGGDLNIIRTEQVGTFIAYNLNEKKKYEIAAMAQGNSVVHLYSSQLKTLSINFPALPEQQKIASFLSAVDKKIEQLQKKKELLEQYKKGMMQKLFSREIRFKDDNGKDFPEWEEKTINQITNVIVGGTPSTTNKKYWNGKIGWLSSGDVNKEIITEPSKYITEEGLKNSSAKLMPPNSVLLAMTGATLGKVGFLTFECSGNQSIAGFIPTNKFYSKFLYYLLKFNTHKILSFAGGGAQAGINKFNIENLFFKFPSIPEQTKIANFLTAIDDKIALTNKQLDGAKTFKKGLLQQLFV